MDELVRLKPPEDAFGEEGVPLHELRRSYHDRISDLRRMSLDVVRAAVAGTDSSVRDLLESARRLESARPSGSDRPLGRDRAEDAVATDVGRTALLAAATDAEAVSLLALESPMATDLRVILTARDVAQLGLLCVGLCDTVGARAETAGGALTPELQELVGDIGARTSELLRQVEMSWATLDADVASLVGPRAEQLRARQTEFITTLIGLAGVPIEAAFDLAIVARAFERLTDHAIEMAERVLFAVRGPA